MYLFTYVLFTSVKKMVVARDISIDGRMILKCMGCGLD